MTILIVEDEAPIRLLITEILEDEGYRVASVRNGMEALAICGNRPNCRALFYLTLECR